MQGLTLTLAPAVNGGFHTEEIMHFTCSICGNVHEGLPDVGFDAPSYYTDIPEDERAGRATLTTDLCTVDKAHFFVRAVLEIPIKGTGDVFAWGVWVTLSKPHFDRYVELLETDPPPEDGPWFGWFSNRLSGYPDTLNLKTHVHLRRGRQRPRVELEPTNHPLAVHQREGIALEHLLAIIGDRLHANAGGAGEV
jgi:hypothetical protein